MMLLQRSGRGVLVGTDSWPHASAPSFPPGVEPAADLGLNISHLRIPNGWCIRSHWFSGKTLPDRGYYIWVKLKGPRNRVAWTLSDVRVERGIAPSPVNFRALEQQCRARSPQRHPTLLLLCHPQQAALLYFRHLYIQESFSVSSLCIPGKQKQGMGRVEGKR